MTHEEQKFWDKIVIKLTAKAMSVPIPLDEAKVVIENMVNSIPKVADIMISKRRERTEKKEIPL